MNIKRLFKVATTRPSRKVHFKTESPTFRQFLGLQGRSLYDALLGVTQSDSRWHCTDLHRCHSGRRETTSDLARREDLQFKAYLKDTKIEEDYLTSSNV